MKKIILFSLMLATCFNSMQANISDEVKGSTLFILGEIAAATCFLSSAYATFTLGSIKPASYKEHRQIMIDSLRDGGFIALMSGCVAALSLNKASAILQLSKAKSLGIPATLLSVLWITGLYTKYSAYKNIPANVHFVRVGQTITIKMSPSKSPWKLVKIWGENSMGEDVMGENLVKLESHLSLEVNPPIDCWTFKVLQPGIAYLHFQCEYNKSSFTLITHSLQISDK